MRGSVAAAVMLLAHLGLAVCDTIPGLPMVSMNTSAGASGTSRTGTTATLSPHWLRKGGISEHLRKTLTSVELEAHREAIKNILTSFLKKKSLTGTGISEENLFDVLQVNYFSRCDADIFLDLQEPSEETHLRFYNVELNYFPTEEINFLEFPKLAALVLWEIKMDDLSDLKCLANLKMRYQVLLIFNSNLTEFPHYLYTRSDLRILNLNRNNITKICFDDETSTGDKKIVPFENLRELHLMGDGNKVRTLTNLAKGMPALERVYVGSKEEFAIWKEMLAEKGNNNGKVSVVLG